MRLQEILSFIASTPSLRSAFESTLSGPSNLDLEREVKIEAGHFQEFILFHGAKYKGINLKISLHYALTVMNSMIRIKKSIANQWKDIRPI